MKLFSRLCSRLQKLCLVVPVIVVGALQAEGQVLYVQQYLAGTIGSYTTTGTPINPALITGEQYHLAMTADDQGYIYITRNDTIAKFTSAGVLVNANLISGLNGAISVGYDRGLLYVGTAGNGLGQGAIGVFDASGAAVNRSLITGLQYPMAIALDGKGDLFTTGAYDSTVAEYSTAGALLNGALVSGLSRPYSLTLDGSNLYVVNNAAGTVGRYTTGGTTVNAALIAGLGMPYGIAADGQGHLFVSSVQAGSVGEYSTLGTAINPALISGLSYPYSVVVVPEPSTPLLALLGLALLWKLNLVSRRDRATFRPAVDAHDVHGLRCGGRP